MTVLSRFLIGFQLFSFFFPQEFFIDYPTYFHQELDTVWLTLFSVYCSDITAWTLGKIGYMLDSFLSMTSTMS